MSVIAKDGKKLLLQMLIWNQEKVCEAISCNKGYASFMLILNANLQLPGKIFLDNNCH